MPWSVDTRYLGTGDILETSSALPFVRHYAIVFIKDNMLYVSHKPAKGIVMQPLYEFKKGRKIYRVFRNERTQNLTRQQIETSSADLSRYQWNLFKNNCEDHVRAIAGTSIGCDNRVILIGGLVVAAFISIYFITRRK